MPGPSGDLFLGSTAPPVAALGPAPVAPAPLSPAALSTGFLTDALIVATTSVASAPFVVVAEPTPWAGALLPDLATPPVMPAARAAPTLRLDRVATPPGAPVTVTGSGCDPGAAVEVEIGRRVLTTLRADDAGAFATRLVLPDLAVGRYEVIARCGPVLATTLDVVLSSRVEPITTALAVLVFFILTGLAVIRRQRTTEFERVA